MTNDGEVIPPLHLQCARDVCHSPRSAEGEHRYCSADCLRIGRAVWAGPTPPDDEWTWAR